MLTKLGTIETSRMPFTSRMLVTAAAVAVRALMLAGNAIAETLDAPIVVRGTLPEALGRCCQSNHNLSPTRAAFARLAKLQAASGRHSAKAVERRSLYV